MFFNYSEISTCTTDVGMMAGIFVFWYNDHILVEGCSIRYNEGIMSPGAFRSMAWDVTILNSIISNNVAGHDFGGIYLDFSLDTIIRNTDMSNNTARGHFNSRTADIGAVGCGSIGVFHSQRTELDNCSLSANDAYLYGGAMCIVYSENVAVRNSKFHGNTAFDGAAVNVYVSENIILDNLRFEDSTAVRDGGGLSVTGSQDVRVVNSTFVGNSATAGSGSACHIVASTVHFDGNIFDGNSAETG